MGYQPRCDFGRYWKAADRITPLRLDQGVRRPGQRNHWRVGRDHLPVHVHRSAGRLPGTHPTLGLVLLLAHLALLGLVPETPKASLGSLARTHLATLPALPLVHLALPFNGSLETGPQLGIQKNKKIGLNLNQSPLKSSKSNPVIQSLTHIHSPSRVTIP